MARDGKTFIMGDGGRKGEFSMNEKVKAIIKEILSWVKVIVLAFVAALLLNKFVIVNANVPTGSMESTIQPDDRLIGFRLSYLFSEPQRGDIVIFEYPVNPEEIYIKRIIALPGETMEIKDAKVYINGSETPIPEPYLKEDWIIENDGLVLTIPEEHYFVMGDNRNDSLDGRYWATEAVMNEMASTLEDAVEKKFCFVSKDAILGKAIFRYYPSIAKME